MQKAKQIKQKQLKTNDIFNMFEVKMETCQYFSLSMMYYSVSISTALMFWKKIRKCFSIAGHKFFY
jgi:hypothetical protein